MSEDDNTNGADDSAYASNTITNDDLNVSVPTSNSLCHNITAISDSSDLTASPQSIAAMPSSPVVSFTSVQIRASNSTTGVDNMMAGCDGNSMIDAGGKPNESCFDPVVSSTNTVEDERLRTPDSDTSNTTASLRIVTPPSEYDQQPTDLSMNNASSSTSTSPFMHVVSLPVEKHPETSLRLAAATAPDTSGLQLLSNMAATAAATTAVAASAQQSPKLVNPCPLRTLTFGCGDFRMRNIKQEPVERSPSHSSGIYDDLSPIDNRRQSAPAEASVAFDMQNDHPDLTAKPYATAATTEPLGGLNLLCALAEQRFQEEVGGSGHRSDRKRSSSSEESEPKRVKKHKEKHAIKKAKKKERKEKKRRGSGTSPVDDTTVVEKDFKETFDRVKAKYAKCDCRKTAGDGATDECCCRGANNWLTPEQMYSAMKSEYRDRLAEIARELQEKKRKLDAMNSKELRLQRESTPSSSKSGGSSSKLSTFSPSILSTSSLECNQSSGIDFTSNGKAPSDSESCSSTSSKRKHFSGPKQTMLDADVQVKRQKSLVGYIFASKKRHNESNSFSTTDEASLNSDNSRTAPTTTTTAATLATTIKQEVFEFDESSTPPEINLFGDSPHHFPRKPLTLAETMVKNQKLGKHAMTKHHKKVKVGKERKHHRRSTETRERKRRISNRCTLTDQHLDALVDGKKIRVLTAMGGLFYAGCLNAVQPPDVYAVTLDGERGNRPHIMSREEILRDAVSVLCPLHRPSNANLIFLSPNFVARFSKSLQPRPRKCHQVHGYALTGANSIDACIRAQRPVPIRPNTRPTPNTLSSSSTTATVVALPLMTFVC